MFHDLRSKIGIVLNRLAIRFLDHIARVKSRLGRGAAFLNIRDDDSFSVRRQFELLPYFRCQLRYGQAEFGLTAVG